MSINQENKYKYLDKLKEDKLNKVIEEIRVNSDKLDKYLGAELLYDQEFLLMHYRSKKFLSIRNIDKNKNVGKGMDRADKLVKRPAADSKFKILNAFSYQIEQSKQVKYGEKVFIYNSRLRDRYLDV